MKQAGSQVKLSNLNSMTMKTKLVFADHDGEEEDSGSLLFDLTTLRRATENFAEENKLGHGGFGAVYKVLLLAAEGTPTSAAWLDNF